MYKPSLSEKTRQFHNAQECLDQLADVADNWKCITRNLSEKEMTLLARDILDKSLRNKAIIKEIDTKGLGLHLATAPSKTNFDNQVEQDNAFDGDCTSDDEPIAVKAPPKMPTQSTKKSLSDRKLKLLNLAINKQDQVKIFRKNYHRKSGGSLFKKYNGILKSYTDSTATFTNAAISDLSFNGSNFNSLASGKDGTKDKQPKDKKSKTKQQAPESSSKEQGT